MSGCLLQQVDTGATVLRMEHLDVVMFQQTRKREDVAEIVVDHQHLLVRQHGIGFVQGREHTPLTRRRGLHPARCSRTTVSSSSRSNDGA